MLCEPSKARAGLGEALSAKVASNPGIRQRPNPYANLIKHGGVDLCNAVGASLIESQGPSTNLSVVLIYSFASGLCLGF